MKSSKIKIFIVFNMILVIAVVTVIFCSGREGFTGSRIKNPDSYLLEIERMNGTDLHTLDLQTGRKQFIFSVHR